MIKKLPTLIENSVLRTKRMQIKSYGNLNERNSNHLTFVLSKKGNNRKNESILEKNKVSVKAGKMI